MATVVDHPRPREDVDDLGVEVEVGRDQSQLASRRRDRAVIVVGEFRRTLEHRPRTFDIV